MGIQQEKSPSTKHHDDDSDSWPSPKKDVVIIFVACVILIGGAYFLSFQSSIPAPDQWGIFGQLTLSILLLGAIVFQSVTYYRQQRVMQDQLKAMQTQSRIAQSTLTHSQYMFAISERPYIGLKEIVVVEHPSLNTHAAIRLEIVNGGRTPACNISANIKGSITNHQTPQAVMSEYFPPPQRVDIQDSVGLLPAGAERTLGSVKLPFSRPIEVKDFDAMKAGTTLYYVLGVVQYSDLHGRLYKFPFIARYDFRDRTLIELVWDRSGTHWQEGEQNTDSNA